MATRLPLLLALLAAPALAIPLEMAPNGSFERDANRDLLPDGWQPAVYKSPGKATWEDAAARTGKRSLRLADSATDGATEWDRNSARWVLDNRAEVKPGQTVTAEVWIQTELTAGSAHITLAWFAESKWLREDSSAKATGTQPWRLHTVTAQAPEEAKYVSVYLCLGSGKGSAWFDDARATRGAKPAGNFRPVDIRSACNTSFRDETAGDGKGGWTDQGPNDLRELPTGNQLLRGIPFSILADARRSCIVLRGKGRQDVDNTATIPVNATCDTLYFLQACAWAGRVGSLVGGYQITFADGTKTLVPLRNGNEIFDWWKPGDLDACALGWEGANAESTSVGLGIFPWTNPKPGVPIASITARTSGRDANLMLVAVTAGDGEPSFPELPLDYRFTDTTGWYEWRFDTANPHLGELDLSRLLDAPPASMASPPSGEPAGSSSPTAPPAGSSAPTSAAAAAAPRSPTPRSGRSASPPTASTSSASMPTTPAGAASSTTGRATPAPSIPPPSTAWTTSWRNSGNAASTSTSTSSTTAPSSPATKCGMPPSWTPAGRTPSRPAPSSTAA